jgi:hypothetical protein
MEDSKCKKCGMAGSGYKCEDCGSEAESHDAEHACGGDKCVVKCSGCGESETKCGC